MPIFTALCINAIFVYTSPAPLDPFAADPPASDPMSTAVPAPESEGWSAPSPPPPPPPPPPAPAAPVSSPVSLAVASGPTEPDEAPSPASSPATTPVDDGKRTITIGLVIVGGAVAAAAGSIYSWREKDRRIGQLEQAEQYNQTVAPEGSPPMPTEGLRDKIELYRGLGIGLAVTAGVLALVGGGVALAGLRKRQRATRVTMQPGGLGWAVQF